jgi:7-cyano-7-deazaguanine synthase
MTTTMMNKPVSEADGAVVLLSGGLDSSVLLHEVRRRIGAAPLVALSFYYGQKHARELEMAAAQARLAGAAHRLADMSFFRDLTLGGSALTDAAIAVPDLAELTEEQRKQPPTYVPNRNMVLLALAAALAESAGCRDVYYGAQKQDRYGYWDCTPDFIERVNDLLALNRVKAVRVRAPFAAMSKAEVVRLGVELKVDFSLTWSCYRGVAPACGTCPTCVERAEAFRLAGLADPAA